MSANTPEKPTVATCFMAAFIAVLFDRLIQAILLYVPWTSANCDALWFKFANMGVAALVAVATTYWMRSAFRRRRAPA